MTASDKIKVPSQSQTLDDLGGKQISELIGDDIKIDATGAVTGTIKKITSWQDFSSIPSEQNGYYFPVILDDKYKDKEITCKGEKTKKARETEWVLLVKNQDSKFTFSTTEDGDILTLTFKGATLSDD